MSDAPVHIIIEIVLESAQEGVNVFNGIIFSHHLDISVEILVLDMEVDGRVEFFAD